MKMTKGELAARWSKVVDEATLAWEQKQKADAAYDKADGRASQAYSRLLDATDEGDVIELDNYRIIRKGIGVHRVPKEPAE